mmetsp:Transcript_15830/g.42747  ORF Transcript_15830/g.42747 Transcript_15830/m.42747 type:complete len:109 (-) Transcript_15830:345-671(-)
MCHCYQDHISQLEHQIPLVPLTVQILNPLGRRLLFSSLILQVFSCNLSNIAYSTHSLWQEFLFAPFSTFSVEAVELSPDPKLQPHRIHLVAAQDNRAEPEDLPLAPWY